MMGYDAKNRCLTVDLFSADMPTEKIAKHLKITKSQTEFVVDALQHYLIASREGGEGPRGGGAVPDSKRWRLDAKRKLLKRFPELRHLPKQEMQQELDGLFKEHLERAQAAYRGRAVQCYLRVEYGNDGSSPDGEADRT